MKRIILDFADREVSGILKAVEERYRQPHATVDHRPRIAQPIRSDPQRKEPRLQAVDGGIEVSGLT